MTKHYVNSKELKANWRKWVDFDCEEAWEAICSDVYKMCWNIAINFRPKDVHEREELTHHAYEITLQKIVNGRKDVKPKIVDKDKAPVFNLLTTAIMRTLYSYKTKEERRLKHHSRYRDQAIHSKRYMVVDIHS